MCSCDQFDYDPGAAHGTPLEELEERVRAIEAVVDALIAAGGDVSFLPVLWAWSTRAK